MKLAVIDVGTRAARLLIAEDNALEGGFEFYRFRNEGARTAMGERSRLNLDRKQPGSTGLGSPDPEKHELAPEAVGRTVEALRNFADRCRSERVDKVIAVGTAALRMAQNRDTVIEQIESETGIRVNPIEQRLEGQLSILAALISMNGTVVPYGASILMIDQGGGSTEISVGGLDDDSKLDHTGNVSLDLGTDRLLRVFLEDVYSDDGGTLSLRERHRRLVESVREQISKTPDFGGSPSPKVAVGIGSAITTATHKKRNRQQHGTRISCEDIGRLVDRHLETREQRTDITPEMADKTSSDLPESLRESLLILCGLPCYRLILERYEHDCLWVCGAGLRYGVFISQVQSRHEWTDSWTGR